MKKTEQGIQIEGEQNILELSVLSDSILRIRRQTGSQEAGSLEMVSHETESQKTVSQEALRQGTESQKANSRAAKRQEMESRDTNSQAANRHAMEEELILTGSLPEYKDWSVRETSDFITIETQKLRAVYSRADSTLQFCDRASGKVILREKAAHFTGTSDENGWTGNVEQVFWSDEDELLGGLGQQADGACNYKGRFVHLNQFNIISAVPVLLSTNGYGLLWNNCSLTEINRRKTPLKLEFNPFAKSFGTVFVPEQTGLYTWIIEKLNKNMGYENLLVQVGDTVVIERGTSWHANYYTGSIRMEAGQEYPVFVNAAVNLYYQTPDQREETSVWSEAGDGIDYCMIYGPEADQIIQGYRRLTGDAPLFPKWAYGYWQSKECYRTAAEVLDIVAEHRRRGHPIDAIVQDWQYWGDFGWNALRFSPEYAGDIEEVTDALHNQDVHFMVSVWPNFGESDKNEAYQEFKEKGFLMDDAPARSLGDYSAALQGFRRNYYDVWNPEARDALWRRMEQGLFRKGVDAWWLDATEPNLWSIQGAYHMYQTCRGPALRLLNAYTLAHSKGIYEHQRQTDESKRVFILSRTGFAGIQKYATAVWSGDTWQSWQTFRRQIADGLQYSLSGLPYWTTDIGGFMGDPCDSPDYRELYVRWFQFGAFCPIFRAHGTKSPREVWRFGKKAEDILHQYLTLRYRLMPYIYSLAWQVTRYQNTIMRSLWMDFRADRRCWEIADQYLFGSSLMVCPVTGKGAVSREVYLPDKSGWYDFWSNRYYDGGASITADAPLETLPLFARAGSILLFGPESMHTCEENPVEIRVYSGSNAEFIWYRDSGDSYAYETGEYAEVRIVWEEHGRMLTIFPQEGGYKQEDQQFFVTVIHPDGHIQSTKPSLLPGEGCRLTF